MENERLIEILAYRLYQASLNGTANGEALRKDMEAIALGDLVLEISVIYKTKITHRLGRLIKIEQEPICSKEEWGSEEPIPTEDVYVILAHGQECRWHNAHFIKVSEKLSFTHCP